MIPATCHVKFILTREYFGTTDEPFAITIGGQSIYVITSANSVEELYKNNTTLSWEHFVQHLYRWIGFSEKAIQRLWQPPTEQQRTVEPMRILSPNEMFAEYQRRQLRPGSKLETMTGPMIDHVNSLLQWQNLSTGQTRTRPSSDKTLSLSLIEWTTYTFIHSLTMVYWGNKIFESDPSLLQTYTTWERTYWKYVFQLPRCFSRDMYHARDKLVNAFIAYFKLPQAERADVAWFTPIAEAELRDIGLDDRDLGRAHMLQHWAYVSLVTHVSMPARSIPEPFVLPSEEADALSQYQWEHAQGKLLDHGLLTPHTASSRGHQRRNSPRHH